MTSSETKITLYKQAKAGLKSLFVQMAQVALGLIVMLVASGGNPPGWMVSASFILGVGFVAWSEKKRQEKPKSETQIKKLSIYTDPLCNVVISIDGTSDPPKSKDLHKTSCINNFMNASNIILKSYLESLKQSWKSPNFVFVQEVYTIKKSVKVWNLRRRLGFHKRPNLKNANLYGANLKGANLKNANLYGANLYGANLVRANLYGANVEKAEFGNNLGIDNELRRNLILRGAIFVDSPEDPGTANAPVRR